MPTTKEHTTPKVNEDISIDVSESEGVRSLHFASHAIQSSMRLKKPFHLELTYTRAMMMFLLFHARPRKILLIGLGGASIPKFIHRFLPDMKSIVVEIHRKVIGVAHLMFHLPPNDKSLKVIHGDGIPFMKEHPESTDVLMIDARRDLPATKSLTKLLNSTGVGCDGFNLFGLVENVAMASVMSDARPGLVLDIVEIGEVPLVEVNILVLSGLMKHPRERPRSLNCWQRKSRSSRGTTVEM